VSAALLAGDVAQGILELEQAFPGEVSHSPDASGGAAVAVTISLTPRWSQPSAPLSFALAYNYPAGAIYPFYLPEHVVLIDGTWPSALQRVVLQGISVIQVSLRHTNWDPLRDNAVGSVLQSQSWLRRQ
jgi:hypothetical protein